MSMVSERQPNFWAAARVERRLRKPLVRLADHSAVRKVFAIDLVAVYSASVSWRRSTDKFAFRWTV